MRRGWKTFFFSEGGSASGGEGKRITLMGLGLLGRGVGDAAFLAACGARVLVTDRKTSEELAPSLRRLKKYSTIRYALGGHKIQDFRNADMVIKAAGVPLDSPYIREARKHKVTVHMSTALFVKLLPPDVTVIGVTGTRGKTTTTNLIYEILKRHTTYNIRHTKSRIFLGGNVRGVSTLAMLPKVKSGDFVILELDSWQLQGFADLKISPHIAVFTTFYPDHMNYYGGSMRKYFSDKASIFTNHETHNTKQKKEGHLIVGEQAMSFVKKWEPKHARRAVVTRASTSPIDWTSKLLGEHNRYNIGCAIAAADALGIPRAITKKAVESFRGVPGRLELVREVRGVKIYNDTTATTPEATIAALRALGDPPSLKLRRARKQNIVLIMGGADKGLDMRSLVREIPKYCKAVLLLAGSGTENFRFQISDFRFKDREAKSLREAVERARDAAKKGDMILFSPAFASFGMFKNEYDRGERFTRLVRTL